MQILSVLFFSKFRNGYHGFFTGSKKEKGEDDSSKKKRPAEEGVNLTPPPAAKAEIPAIVEIRLSMGRSPRWSDVLHVV